MELRQLTTFSMVAHTLSFSRAATALNYVQSSVTAQIQALEEDLGVQLFDRLGKRVALTEAGKKFLLYTEKILNLVDEARYAVTEGEQFTGTVTISAPESLCTYRLPAVLQEFHKRFPQARLVFRPDTSLNLRRNVSEGSVDIVFVMDEPVHSTTLVVEPLMSEKLLVLASPDHRLARLPCVQTEDLDGACFLLTEKGCMYRNGFERALNAAGIDVNTDLEFTSVEAIKQCAMVGMGIAFLPEITVATELAQGKLVALHWEGHHFEATTQMLWHKEKWLSPAIHAFLNIIREVMAADTRPILL